MQTVFITITLHDKSNDIQQFNNDRITRQEGANGTISSAYANTYTDILPILQPQLLQCRKYVTARFQ